MIFTPIDILNKYPVRKTRSQKKAFRDAIVSYAQTLGFDCRIEQGSFGVNNVVIGNPQTAQYLLTAHYDTCAWLPFPNMLTPRSLFLFLAYQIGITLLILATPLAVAVPIWLLSGSIIVGYIVWTVFIWLFLFLILFGPANKHNANDNTSGIVTVLEMARSIPDIYREKVCFILFDLEEAGLFGSAAYRKKHRAETDHQLVLNFDCVGDGNKIYYFPGKNVRKHSAYMKALKKCSGVFGKKTITVHEKGFSLFPSDQGNFPYGVGICALQKGKLGLYLSRIHTSADTILDLTNVNILRAAVISMISCSAME